MWAASCTQEVQLWHHELVFIWVFAGNCGIQWLPWSSAEMAGWGDVVKCNFTGREAKQYSGEQGL